MSSPLAIGAVSAVLRNLLDNGLVEAGAAMGSTVAVSAVAPDTILGPGAETPDRLGEPVRGAGLLITAPPLIGQWTVTATGTDVPPRTLGFSVNVPDAETRLATLSEAELNALFGGPQGYVLTDDTEERPTGAGLLAYTFLDEGAAWWLVLLWVGFELLVLLNTDAFRLRYVTRPFLRTYRRLLPAMSDTEREALEAGTVWWDGELFSGCPNWHRLLAAKSPMLTASGSPNAERTTSAVVHGPTPGSDRRRRAACVASTDASSQSARRAARRMTSARRRSMPSGWKAWYGSAARTSGVTGRRSWRIGPGARSAYRRWSAA